MFGRRGKMHFVGILILLLAGMQGLYAQPGGEGGNGEPPQPPPPLPLTEDLQFGIRVTGPVSHKGVTVHGELIRLKEGVLLDGLFKEDPDAKFVIAFNLDICGWLDGRRIAIGGHIKEGDDSPENVFDPEVILEITSSLVAADDLLDKLYFWVTKKEFDEYNKSGWAKLSYLVDVKQLSSFRAAGKTIYLKVEKWPSDDRLIGHCD